MRAVKREALRRGQTMSEMVEGALRAALSQQPPTGKLPPLPRFHGGRIRVNVADRNALYEAMER